MRKLKKYVTLLTLCLLFIVAKAQDDCKESLYLANKLFEAGNIRDCINLLEPCTKKKETDKRKYKEELIESYHLLALAYLNTNDINTAKAYIKKMLLLKPDYQKFPNIDPLDFSKLVNQFTVFPKFYLGVKMGVNINSISLKKSYSAYASSQSYNPTTGYQFGLTADYRVLPSVSINGDFLLSGLGINHIVDSAGGWKQNYNEQQNYLLMNLSAQYHFMLGKKISINAGLGMGLGYLYAANVFFETTNITTGYNQQATQNPIAARNRVQKAALGLLGIEFPLTKGTLGLETTFAYFLGNTVNPAKRLDDMNFIFDNQYVNDDISLRLVMVNLSYKFPLKWNVQLKK